MLGGPSRTLRNTPLPPGTVRGIPELGWPPCRRHGRGFRRATCGPLLRFAGNASSLESVPRRSVPQTAFCTFRQALLCSASRDRALVCSGTSCHRFGLRAAVPPKLRLRMRGQWAPLDADMFVLIDRSSCLVDRDALRKVLCSPSCSSRAAPVALDTKSSRLAVLCTLSP